MTETEKMQGEVKDKMKPDMDSKKRMMYMSIKKKKNRSKSGRDNGNDIKS